MFPAARPEKQMPRGRPFITNASIRPYAAVAVNDPSLVALKVG